MSDHVVSNASAAATCVEMVRDLITQINNAIDAVSRNALAEFELSLWNQEMSCAALKRLIRRPVPIGDRELQRILRKELETLMALTRSYEHVVERAGASTTLLLDLCSLHTAQHRAPYPSTSWEA